MRICLLFIISLLNFSVYAQQWDWAKKEGGWFLEYGWDCASDVSGNTYEIMEYYEDQNVNNIVYLPCISSSLLIKYSANGSTQWARRICGYAVVSVDNFGNCLVSGQVADNSLFENGNGGYDTVTTNGYSDAYVAKYSSSGVLLWITLYSQTDQGESGVRIKVDASNNIYLLCHSSTQFASRFIFSKFDSNGNILWNITSNWGYNGADEFDLDKFANIYLIGNASSTTCIGQDTVYASASNRKIFICKIDSSGNVQWIKEEPGYADCSGLKVSSFGNIFITGIVPLTYSASFGSTAIADINFLAKYDTSGNFIWLKTFSTSSYPLLEVDNSEGIYLSASFSGSVVFYQDSLIIATQTSSSFFISKFNGNGNFQWYVKSNGSNSSKAIVQGSSRDSLNNIFITGKFQDSLILGSNILFYSDTGMLAPFGDFFIIKLSTNSLSNIGENNNVNFVSVFPNPSSGIFTVDLGNCRDAKICVYDVLGSCLLKKDCLYDVAPKIDLSSQPRGIYFMEIVSDGARAVKKIVLE